ncbi:MAG: sugar ABC transporter ATP-binding protein [Treponema sp.]|jgi:ABC-type sugar transport system ATPase subunit|nr:sugar ABC transporter ATP-binding protein [Treponema sp.]
MAEVVEFRNISKFFPGVRALENISFSAQKGYVYALMGENGAGKSTLLKILNGDYIPDKGEFLIDGKVKHFQRPKDAIECGISTIYQERQVIRHMTVAENVFLGDWPRSKANVIDFGLMNRLTVEIAERFKIDIKPDVKVNTLSVAHQQMVEIMKAVRRNSVIIAFDEPTASLSDNEIEILFSIIRKLQEENRIIFYVSHRINEVNQIAQKVIVFKDGRLVGQKDQDKAPIDELIQMMVGRTLDKQLSESYKDRSIGQVLFSCDNLTTDFIRNISFSVRRGEILGFAGLVGAGRTEIMRAIFGIDKIYSGVIKLLDKPIKIRSPKKAIKNGLVMLPEDRKDQGVLPNISVKGNISVSMLREICSFGIVNQEKEDKIAARNIAKFDIRTPDSEKLLLQLSGGNQQKTILARCLECNPKVLILDEPTKGIDVGAKAEFHRIIFDCAKAGMAVIVVSSELPELISLSDRIIVIRDRNISGELERKDFSEEKILKFAMPREE